jgi:uncharacterized protein YkwD
MGARSHSSRGLSAAPIALAVTALAVPAPAVAAPPATAPASLELDALNLARARGCDGLPAAPPLVASAALDALAARLAAGESFDAAVVASSVRTKEIAYYRVPRATSPDALAFALAKHHCRGIAKATLVEAGVATSARDAFFVVAVPFAPAQGINPAALRSEVIALVNVARAQGRRCGTHAMPAAPPLSANPLLAAAAQSYANELAARGSLSHEAADGSTPRDRVARAGYAARFTAENLAAGPITAREVVDEWLASPGHCANLMDDAFTQMGVAFALNPRAERGIYWVQLLATPR